MLTTLADDFNDGTVSNEWEAFTIGTGASVNEVSQHLEVRFAPNAAEVRTNPTFQGGLASTFTAHGDFDIQVDYALLDFPFANGVRVGIIANEQSVFWLNSRDVGAVERVSFGRNDWSGRPRDSYLTHFKDGVRGFVATDDTAGKLRLTRTGRTVRGYRHDGTRWVLIHATQNVSTNDVPVYLAAWSHDYAFADKAVRVAFDNLSLTADAITYSTSPEPHSNNPPANPTRADEADQPSLIYRAAAGELAVDSPANVELTSINITSAAGIFTGEPAQNLGGPFDNDTDDNIFKAIFGGTFGSTTFGPVAEPFLKQAFLNKDLTVIGSLSGGLALGNVNLVYVAPSLWPNGIEGDEQTSVIYDASKGTIAVDPPVSRQLAAINITSAAGIFTGEPAQNLGGPFDNDTDDNIFKAVFGGSFGPISFGDVAEPYVHARLLLSDLTVNGTLVGGGALGDVDLIYIRPGLFPNGREGDGQTSIVYNAATGEIAVDPPDGKELHALNIDSAVGIFTGQPAHNLGGPFDNDTDHNIFKATFGSSFGAITFGDVAQAGLDEELVLRDLRVMGGVVGEQEGLRDVDLIYLNAMPSNLGDANRDGVFNQLDVVSVLQAGKYLTGQPATFAEGDWNKDGLFGPLDIVKALQVGRYQPRSDEPARDTAPPAPSDLHLTPASDSGLSSNDGVTNDNTPTIAGEAENGSLVQLIIDDKAAGRTTATGSWQITTDALSDGPHTITATAQDAAGNVSGRSDRLIVTIDTVRPSLPTFDLHPEFDSDPVGDGTTTFELVTLVGRTAASTNLVLEPGSVMMTSDSMGRFEFTGRRLALGNNQFTVRATDLAGNETTFSNTIARILVEEKGPRFDIVFAQNVREGDSFQVIVQDAAPHAPVTVEVIGDNNVTEDSFDEYSLTTDADGNETFHLIFPYVLGRGFERHSRTIRVSVGDVTEDFSQLILEGIRVSVVTPDTNGNVREGKSFTVDMRNGIGESRVIVQLIGDNNVVEHEYGFMETNGSGEFRDSLRIPDQLIGLEHTVDGRTVRVIHGNYVGDFPITVHEGLRISVGHKKTREGHTFPLEVRNGVGRSEIGISWFRDGNVIMSQPGLRETNGDGYADLTITTPNGLIQNAADSDYYTLHVTHAGETWEFGITVFRNSTPDPEGAARRVNDPGSSANGQNSIPADSLVQIALDYRDGTSVAAFQSRVAPDVADYGLFWNNVPNFADTLGELIYSFGTGVLDSLTRAKAEQVVNLYGAVPLATQPPISPENALVVVLYGANQIPNVAAVANVREGMDDVARSLIDAGNHVLSLRSGDSEDFLGFTREGLDPFTARRNAENAIADYITDRNIDYVVMAGYSWGGGLAQELGDWFTNKYQASVELTGVAFIDAIDHVGTTAENAFPNGARAMLNIYQDAGEGDRTLNGGPLNNFGGLSACKPDGSPLGCVTEMFVDNNNETINHFNIDDAFATVVSSWIERLLSYRLQEPWLG